MTLSLTGINKMGGGMVYFLDNDNTMPYIYADSQFQYFIRQGKGYVLAMTSLHDINEAK